MECTPYYVKADLILEVLVSPPELKYLLYPPRHNPFMLRVAYVNLEHFTEGSIATVALLHDGWHSGGTPPWRDNRSDFNWPARRLLDRIQEMTRDQPGLLEE